MNLWRKYAEMKTKLLIRYFPFLLVFIVVVFVNVENRAFGDRFKTARNKKKKKRMKVQKNSY